MATLQCPFDNDVEVVLEKFITFFCIYTYFIKNTVKSLQKLYSQESVFGEKLHFTESDLWIISESE